MNRYTVDSDFAAERKKNVIYYVSTNGNDLHNGTKTTPFRTINHAAGIAVAGDVVRVHGGTYREWVDPKNSGVLYEAVEGEHPVIKGSEIVTDWEPMGDNVWKKTIPNSLFGAWNPFALTVEGDWLVLPSGYQAHLGDVYLNGVSLFEAKSMADLYDLTPRTTGCQNTGNAEPEYIPHPEQTLYKWYAVVTDETTTLYCNFGAYDPNREEIEINVRPCCFYPKNIGVNDITLRGFEIAQAACPWTPPTADQIGMVGPHWSRGWVIENNHLHDAKCSAISLGKDGRTGHNESACHHQKTGHRYQLEAVFSALQMGWNKENVGSHIVRNNVIHDCGQNGIVGHLGCIFSRIEHNHIYNIGTKHEFWGHEIAGIKFHTPIDTIIINNHIHDCTLGMWLDWEAQGTRVTRNLLYGNYHDLMLEVSHGPTLIDHNLFLSRYALDYLGQGSAFVHNLFGGKLWSAPVLDRTTPYHFPHATDVAGCSEVYGGDDRYCNNIFIAQRADGFENLKEFIERYDQYTSAEDYAEQIEASILEKGYVDHNAFTAIPQPVRFQHNAYSGQVSLPVREEQGVIAEGMSVKIEEQDGEYTLVLRVPTAFAQAECVPISTPSLGKTRISALPFDAPDGADVDFSFDLLGRRYGSKTSPGPLASLKAGEQRICIWKN